MPHEARIISEWNDTDAVLTPSFLAGLGSVTAGVRVVDMTGNIQPYAAPANLNTWHVTGLSSGELATLVGLDTVIEMWSGEQGGSNNATATILQAEYDAMVAKLANFANATESDLTNEGNITFVGQRRDLTANSVGEALALNVTTSSISSAITDGGNGGTLVVVTNLNDSGIGSFRAAMEGVYKRYVQILVDGTVTLDSPVVAAPQLTLDATDADFCVRGAQVVVANDTIVQNLRSRNGVPSVIPLTADSLTINGDDVHLIQCSLTWGADANLSIHKRNILIERCLLAEGLTFYNNKNVFVATGGGDITFYKCVLASTSDRNPSFFSGYRVDMFNCIVSNYGAHTLIVPRDSETQLNLINNLYIPLLHPGGNREYIAGYGVATEGNNQAYIDNSGQYLAGNVNEGATEPYDQDDLIQPDNGEITIEVVATPYAYLHINPTTLDTVDATMESDVLDNAGAQPHDACDARIVAYIAARDQEQGHVANQGDVGGYPDLTV